MEATEGSPGALDELLQQLPGHLQVFSCLEACATLLYSDNLRLKAPKNFTDLSFEIYSNICGYILQFNHDNSPPAFLEVLGTSKYYQTLWETSLFIYRSTNF
jgi:hypothetical protein